MSHDAALPPGPYRLEWPDAPGGLFKVWGRPKSEGGWAIPLVAMGAQSPMEWLVETLTELSDRQCAPECNRAYPHVGRCAHVRSRAEVPGLTAEGNEMHRALADLASEPTR